MAARYENASYNTLEEALAARDADTSQTNTITLEGTTNATIVTGGTLSINDAVSIVGVGVGAGGRPTLTGNLQISADNVSISDIAFQGTGDVVTIIGDDVSITDSVFEGNASGRAIVASGEGLTFSGNTINNFGQGGYINPGVTGSISDNTISNSGNGFVNDSDSVDIAGNTFIDIARSNISISANEADGTVNLADYFGENTFDGTGTQIAATRFEIAKNIIGTDFDERIVMGGDVVTGYTFDGKGGNDLIESSNFADTFTGGTGQDAFSGSVAQLDGDTIKDFGVDDRIVINGASASTSIAFEAGDNNSGVLVITDGGTVSRVTLENQVAGSYLLSASGVVTFVAAGAAVVGTSGADTIEGSAEADTISGGLGNDTIDGGEGDNVLFGNQGDDTLSAGNGSNTIYGGQGNDTITVGEPVQSDAPLGRAAALAVPASNLIYGGQGSDQITVNGDSNNTVYGGSGVADSADRADVINIIGSGSNTVYGGAGDDQITVQTAGFFGFSGGSTSIYGEAGNDQIGLYGGSAESESFVSGGAGSDEITVFTAGAVTVLGSDAAGDLADGADIINVYLADNASAEIYGNLGNDVIGVESGFSTPEAGGATSATVYGGQGNDQISVQAHTAAIFGGVGGDTINVAGLGLNAAVTVYGGNEANVAGDTADTINVTVDAGSTATVFGNIGNDVITLGGEQVSAGQYTVYGGQDDDQISGTVGDGSQVYGGIGADSINLVAAGENASVTVYGGNGISSAEDGGDSIVVGLSEGHIASIFGNGGDDAITVNVGVDASATVFGGQGDDFIVVNGEGSSTVIGGLGNDTLIADSSGSDFTFTGGAGEDIFGIIETVDYDVNTAENAASVGYITDLNLDEDSLSFNYNVDTGVDLVGLTPYPQQAAQFDLIAAAETVADAGKAAIAFLLEANLAEAGQATGVLFAWNNDSYLAVDADTGGDLDSLVRVTGYTGTLDADDFGSVAS